MKRITSTDHSTFQDIECCKKAGSPVTFIIVRHGSSSPPFHRQSRLGSVQRLDLRLFIDAQHEGLSSLVASESEMVFLQNEFSMSCSVIAHTRFCNYSVLYKGHGTLGL